MKSGSPLVMRVVLHVALPVVLPLLLLSFARPAVAQSHVYTNADLNKPLSTHRPVPTAETMEALAAHQFALAEHYDGPYVVGVFSSPTAGPFGEFWPQIQEPWLDGSPLSYTPFGYAAFGPRTYFGRSQAPLTRSPLHAHRSTDTRPGVRHQPHHRTR
jgi:hypothetical protein